MTLVYIDCWYKDTSGHIKPPIRLDVRIDMKGDIKSQIHEQRGTRGQLKLDSYRFSGQA